MGFLLKGIILGFSIAAPVGPIGLLCIRRTLAEGKASGFVSGLGAATADALYGFIAAFGLTAVSTLLLDYQLPIRTTGSLFLFYLAVKIFISKPAEKTGEVGLHTPLWKSYASTFFLTLTNPATALSFVAVFAGLGVASNEAGYLSGGSMVLGVFLGSALWWLLLSGGVGLFRKKLDVQKLVWVNRISGILIATLGLISLLGIKF